MRIFGIMCFGFCCFFSGKNAPNDPLSFVCIVVLFLNAISYKE